MKKQYFENHLKTEFLMDRKDPLKVLQGHKTFEKSSKIGDTYKNGDRKPYEGLPRIPVLIKASFRQKIFQRSSGDRSIFKRLIKIKNFPKDL